MNKWLLIGIVVLAGLGAGIVYSTYKGPITSRPQSAQHAITPKSNPSPQQLPAAEQPQPHQQPTAVSSTAMQAKAVSESKPKAALAEAKPNPGLNSLPLPADSTRTLPDLRCNQDFSDSNVAKAIGTTGEKLLLLKKLRALTNQEICGLPNRAVAKVLSRLNKPKPDHPGDWASFRALQRRGDDGKVKPDGLIEGLKQRRAILDKAQASASSTTPTTAADGSIVMPAAGITSAQWTALGPGNIGGRIRAILIDRTNTSRIWLGSVSGGIWKSTDAGASWSPVNDFMGNLSISSLVMDPNNANILYAGTGEGFYNADAVRGAGIFKSTDGGTTWSQLSSTNPANTTDWYYVNRIAMHPTDSTIMLAATNNGVYRSADAGSSWSKVFSDRTLDISFDPNNGNKALLGDDNGNIAYSTNAGASWTTVMVAAGGRVEVAYAKSAADTAYICVNQNSGDIYKTSDAGQSWTKKSNANHLSNQGWYDNAIWVDPTDANHLVVGGIDLYRSTDGALTWTKISNWANNSYYGYPSVPHADHHSIIADPGYDGTTNRKIYNGNDGGIFRSDNITLATETAGWTRLNNSLYITQFYGAAGSAANGGRVYGGTQDNGSLRQSASGTDWSQVYGGDGGYAAVDPQDPNYLYGEYVYLALHRATDGIEASDIYAGITDAGSATTALFIAPFILDPNNSSRIYAGGQSLWVSTNVKAATPTWSKVTTLSYTGERISAIAVAEGNDQIIWVGYADGTIYRSLDGGTSWTRVDNGITYRMVTRILIDKDTPATVYVAYGGYANTNLYKTTNSGSSWTSIHGNLPAVPVFGLARHPANSAWLYAGTEVGLFTSTDGGATWGTTNDGPANVEISELFWLSSSPAVLVAATHGRGVFKANLDIDQKALAVTKTGTGSGTVTSTPTGISCGASCTAYFPTSSEVTLTATADSGSIFSGWSGGGCSGTGSCTVTLTDNTNVTAAFTRQVSLNVQLSSTAAGLVKGGGSISGSGISCSAVNGGSTTGTCSGSFNSGSTVTLAAAADANSTFTTFIGPTGCTTAGGCSFSINADTTVTGSFAGAYKAKILNLTGGDDTLTTAHTRAGSGATILARELHNATTLVVEPFTENLTVTKAITLKGGYNADFNSNVGLYSTLSGILTVGSGSLTVENLIVK